MKTTRKESRLTVNKERAEKIDYSSLEHKLSKSVTIHDNRAGFISIWVGRQCLGSVVYNEEGWHALTRTYGFHKIYTNKRKAVVELVTKLLKVKY